MAHVTVPATTPSAEFTVGGTPTTGPWTIPAYIVFFEQADLRVQVGGAELDQADFVVVGNGSGVDGYAGGELTLDSAVSSTTIQVFRDMQLGRATDFIEGSPLRRADLNTQVDMLAAQMVDLNVRLKRGAWAEPLVGSLEFDPMTPEDRAGLGLGYDLDGNLVLGASAGFSVFATMAQAVAGVLNTVVMTPLRVAEAIAGGAFYLASGVGGVLRSFTAKAQERITPEDYGAAGDGVTDDTAAVTRAIAAATLHTGAAVWMPNSYAVTGLTVAAGVTLQGTANIRANKGGDNPASGTLFTQPRIKLASSGTITLMGSAALCGLVIIRASMAGTEPDPTAYAGTAITIGGCDTSVESCLIVGFNRAYTSTSFYRNRIRNVLADCINGFYQENNLDSSDWSDIWLWPIGTIATPSPVTPFGTSNYLFRNGNAFHFKGANDWQRLIGCGSFGYLNAVRIEGATEIDCVSFDCDNISQAVAPYIVTNSRGVYVTGASARCKFLGGKIAAVDLGADVSTSVPGSEFRFVGTDIAGKTRGVTNAGADLFLDGGIIQCYQDEYGTGGVGIAQVAASAGHIFISDQVKIKSAGFAIDGNSVKGAIVGYGYDATAASTGILPFEVTTTGSGGVIALPEPHKAIKLLGTTTIGTITPVPNAGREIVLTFGGAITLNHGGTMLFQNASNFSGTTTNAVKFWSDGTNLFQI